RDLAVAERADKGAVFIEHDDRWVGALANIEATLGIYRAFADHAEFDRCRQRAERPLHAIHLLAQPDMQRCRVHQVLPSITAARPPFAAAAECCQLETAVRVSSGVPVRNRIARDIRPLQGLGRWPKLMTRSPSSCSRTRSI